MATQKHPLDIDLLAMVRGDLTADSRSEIESHAQSCLLCRIRMGRLARAAGMQWTSAEADAVPKGFVQLPNDLLTSLSMGIEEASPEMGQLWLAGSDEYLMVWIRKAHENSLVCHPVTLDVEIADDKTFVINKEQSPIGVPLALWTGIIGDVQPSNLYRLLGDLDVRASIDALQSDSFGLEVGIPISGPTDERVEYRQLIADRLAELSEAVNEVDRKIPDQVDLTDTASSIRRFLEIELEERRGSGCQIAYFQAPELDYLLTRFECRLVGLVSEVTCKILVVAGFEDPTKLRGGPDVYQEMVRLARATGLALVADDPPYLACIYDPEHLAPIAIEKETGDWVHPSPRLGPMVVDDALFKYLEQEVRPLDADSSKEPIQPAVNLDELIRAKALAMIEVKKVKRTPITPKKDAQQALSGREADILFRLISAASRGRNILEELESLPDAP